eukprot:TRINITY_DN1174_c0_g1_i1.p1 TRINITY_DN1174_c0_g1~~TRINITY_DN1174_c0_g1_i1.p1  ORF type:complete len:324 (-),score=61.91 TRINITY_DN1174_c0_g1_i1:178-1149(-)
MRPILLKGHERSITHLKFNRDGDLLFSTSKATFPCVWYSDNGERLGTYMGHTGAIWSLDVDFDTTTVITGGADSRAKLWDAETGKEIADIPHRAPVKWVAFAEGDKQFLTLTDQVMGHLSGIFIYNMEGRRPVGAPIEIPGPSNCKLNTALWGPQNKTIFVSGDDSLVRVYDVETRKQVAEIRDHTKPISRITMDKHGVFLLTASKDGTSKLYDVKTLQHLKTYDTGRPVNGVSMSPIKDHVILGGGQSAESVTTSQLDSKQFRVRFYHSIFEQELGSVPGHFGPVNVLSFSPDGKSFASGGEDGYIRLHHFDQDYLDTPDEI